MARGFKSPALQAPLPKVSFVIVRDDDINQPAGVHDLQARSYGCMTHTGTVKLTLTNRFLDNDFSEFQKPDHYIRYIGERVHVK